MVDTSESNWDITVNDEGKVIYTNRTTGISQEEAPYESHLKQWRNADPEIWSERRQTSIKRATVHPRPRCFFDINFGDHVGGRVTIELFADLAPLAAYNFLMLCTGELPNYGKQPLKYQGSIFHRILPSVGAMGGDIVQGLGYCGGFSIYGAPFDDENLEMSTNKEGLLISISDLPNMNLSQFLITTGPCPQFYGKNTVFGHVIKGMSVIRSACAYVNDAQGIPSEIISISRSGELPPGPIPADFTLPVMPCERENPNVPVAPKAITGSHVVIGAKEAFMKEANIIENMENGVKRKAEDSHGDDGKRKDISDNDIPIDNEAKEKGEEENNNNNNDNNNNENETNNNENETNNNNVQDGNSIPADANASYYPYNYAYASGYTNNMDPNAYNYNYWSYYGYNNNDNNNNVADYSVQGTFNAKTGQFIGSGEGSYWQRKGLSDDKDARFLSYFMDPTALQVTETKKKENKLPSGFKNWKEYGQFKKQQKRDKQIKEMLKDPTQDKDE
ncbi:hypothetical protein WA158_007836 [Blastocystis sp. Blastoise]